MEEPVGKPGANVRRFDPEAMRKPSVSYGGRTPVHLCARKEQAIKVLPTCWGDLYEWKIPLGQILRPLPKTSNIPLYLTAGNLYEPEMVGTPMALLYSPPSWPRAATSNHSE